MSNDQIKRRDRAADESTSQHSEARCENLLLVLRHHCGDGTDPDALYEWALRWLAYPLQHPGAKMETSLVLQGPQGSGKSTFFDAILQLYGQEGCEVDQDSLEGRFNEWACAKRFVVADEVSPLRSSGLKQFITSPYIRINAKGSPEKEERNQMNLVFLTSEAMPLELADSDRRFALVRIQSKPARDLQRAARLELEAGGAVALRDFLLHLDLGDFNERTPAPGRAAGEAPHPLLQRALFMYAAGSDGVAAVLIRGWPALVERVQQEVAGDDWEELLSDLEEWRGNADGMPTHYTCDLGGDWLSIFRITEGEHHA